MISLAWNPNCIDIIFELIGMGAEVGQTSWKLLDLYRTGELVTTWKIQVLLVLQNFYRAYFFSTLDTLWQVLPTDSYFLEWKVLCFDSNFSRMCSYKHDKDPITGINNDPAWRWVAGQATNHYLNYWTSDHGDGVICWCTSHSLIWKKSLYVSVCCHISATSN